jgi:hypothetical protein
MATKLVYYGPHCQLVAEPFGTTIPVPSSVNVFHVQEVAEPDFICSPLAGTFQLQLVGEPD